MSNHVNQAPSFARQDVTQSRLSLYLIVHQSPGLNGHLALFLCKLPPILCSYRILLHVREPREDELMHDDPIMAIARLQYLYEQSHNEPAPPNKAKYLEAGVVCSRQRK
jgi:hypothetical protein